MDSDGGDVLSQALDMAEEEMAQQLFLKQNTFSNITESQIDAIHHPIDISDMLDFGGPCTVGANRRRQTVTATNSAEVMSEKAEATGTGVNKEGCSRRFVNVSEEIVQERERPFVPLNTIRKNKWSLNLFNKWRIEVLQSESSTESDKMLQTLQRKSDLTLYTDDELLVVLSRFFVALRKEDGSEYKGDSIVSIACGLQRHLQLVGREVKFLADSQFTRLKNVIDNTMQDKCAKGISLTRKPADIITETQEKYLWYNDFFGTSSPSVLVDTLLWTIGINFGLRGGDEHRRLTFENFQIKCDEDDQRYLQYTEAVSKTYRGGLGHRNVDPHSERAYENKLQPEKCPVRIFERYESKLPPNRNPTVFYFQPLSKPKSNVWYSLQSIGHNRLEGTVKRIMTAAGFRGRFTNHSLRATTATRLFRAGVPEQLVKEQTGHRSSAVESYKRRTDSQKRKISDVLQVNETVSSDRSPPLAKYRKRVPLM